MSKPTADVIRTHLQRHKVKDTDLDKWARFLHGLNWKIIKPLVQMAVNAHVHPALAAGMVIRSTQDETVRDTLQAHLETKAGTTN